MARWNQSIFSGSPISFSKAVSDIGKVCITHTMTVKLPAKILRLRMAIRKSLLYLTGLAAQAIRHASKIVYGLLWKIRWHKVSSSDAIAE
jgi:hypothetical protein